MELPLAGEEGKGVVLLHGCGYALFGACQLDDLLLVSFWNDFELGGVELELAWIEFAISSSYFDESVIFYGE